MDESFGSLDSKVDVFALFPAIIEMLQAQEALELDKHFHTLISHTQNADSAYTLLQQLLRLLNMSSNEIADTLDRFKLFHSATGEKKSEQKNRMEVGDFVLDINFPVARGVVFRPNTERKRMQKTKKSKISSWFGKREGSDDPVVDRNALLQGIVDKAKQKSQKSMMNVLSSIKSLRKSKATENEEGNVSVSTIDMADFLG